MKRWLQSCLKLKIDSKDNELRFAEFILEFKGTGEEYKALADRLEDTSMLSLATEYLKQDKEPSKATTRDSNYYYENVVDGTPTSSYIWAYLAPKELFKYSDFFEYIEGYPYLWMPDGTPVTIENYKDLDWHDMLSENPIKEEEGI